MPVFSTIAAMICMQPYVENSKTVAFNRIIGTLTGAVMGILVSYFIREIPQKYEFLQYLIISAAVIPAMYITVLLKKTGASAMAGVVLLGVTLSTGNYPPMVDAFNRSFETIVGILVSLGSMRCTCPDRNERNFSSSQALTVLYMMKNAI